MPIKTQRFRQLIEAPKILIQPGIYDGFSARLVQRMGFKSAAISGEGLSMEQRFPTTAQKQAKYGVAAE
jgi:2-methylisocitrate lyase-like PEP mutase family enzyme